MLNKKNLIYSIFGCFLTLFCATGGSFADTTVHTNLSILPPPYEIVYEPAYITGHFTSGFVYVSLTGNGIKSNTSGIWNNGTYTFPYYRGTGPFTTGAGYSSGNLRSLITTTQTINRIDNIPPTFLGVTEGVTYNSAVTITFSDNLSGVTATLNGLPFTYGTIISTNGTYQLIIRDMVGNTTGATFIIYLDGTPSGGGGGNTLGLQKDLCTLPSSLSCANQEGKDYSSSYYDGSCCLNLSENGSALGTWILLQNVCEARNCYSSYYDTLCGPCTISPLPTLPSLWPAYHYATPDTPNIHGSAYPKEWIDAYQRAYNLGIVSISDINKANLEGVLYRKFAAKMASEFAIKVVDLKPDTTRVCEFTDITNEDLELQYYMKLSCQLGIMGLDYYGDPDTIFNPNYIVTRDQFVTILSRIIFRDEYNLEYEELSFLDKTKNFAIHTLNNITKALRLHLEINTPLDRYTKHLEIIKKLGIMTNYTINIKEFKIFVLLIMYRLDHLGIENVQHLSQ